MIPRAWANPLLGLKARDYQVATALFSFGSKPDHPAFPSLEVVAEIAGCSLSTVQRVLRRLESKGLIRRVKRGRTTAAYTVADLTTNVVTIVRNADHLESHDPAQERPQSRTFSKNLVDSKEKERKRTEGLAALAEIAEKHPFLKRA